MLSTGSHIPRSIIADDESGECDDGSTVATSASGDNSEVETSAWTKLGMALLLVDPGDDDESCCFPGSMVSSSCCDSSSTFSGSSASCDYSTVSGDDDASRSTSVFTCRDTFHVVSPANAQPVNVERNESNSITKAIVDASVQDDAQEATHANSVSTSTENRATAVPIIIISEVISTTPEETETRINCAASEEGAPKNLSKASQALPLALFRQKATSFKIGKKILPFSHSPRTHQHGSKLCKEDLRSLVVNNKAAQAKGQEAKAIYRIEVVLREEDLVGTQAKPSAMARLTRNLFERK